MKRLHLHSVSDVTTNSSSEMFVCDTKLTPKKVKEILASLLNAYCDAQEISRSFSSVFGEVRLATEEDRETAETYEKFEQEQKERLKYDPMLLALLYSGDSEHKGRIPEVGKDVVIFSAEDNSIPYDLFNIIQKSFNAARYHLG